MGKLIPQSVRGVTFYFLSVILLDFAAIEVECSFITHVILYFNLMMPVSAIIEIYDLCSSLTLLIFFGGSPYVTINVTYTLNNNHINNRPT